MPQRNPGGRSRRKTEAMADAGNRNFQVLMSKMARLVKKICQRQPRTGGNSESCMVLRRFGSQAIFHEVTRLEQTRTRRDLDPTLHFDICERARSALQGVFQILSLGAT